MVTENTRHNTRWLSPTNMWNSLRDATAQPIQVAAPFVQPAILRFNTDTFMEELQSTLAYHPDQLVHWKVQPETWREPMAKPEFDTPLQVAETPSLFSKQQAQQVKKFKGPVVPVPYQSNGEQDPDKPLKLFQPAHQRFYLVTASLVCRQAGLPDKFVDTGKEEKVSFVIRRLLPKNPVGLRTPATCDPADFDEYAFVLTEQGSQWLKASIDDGFDVEQILPNEERLPMFPVGFQEDQERNRKLLAGYIPVAKREVYLNANAVKQVSGDLAEAEEGEEILDPKVAAITRLFQQQVAGPWKGVISQAVKDKKLIEGDVSIPKPPIVTLPEVPAEAPDGQEGNLLQISREKIQTTSWYILIDFAQFLKDYIPNLYAVFSGEINSTELDIDADVDLYNAINNTVFNVDASIFVANTNHSIQDLETRLSDALTFIIDNSDVVDQLENVDYEYDRTTGNSEAEIVWPDFIFPFADPVYTGPLPNLVSSYVSDSAPDTLHEEIDALTDLITAAIPQTLSRVAPETLILQQPKFDNGDGWFVIRCAYEHPNCGPFNPALLSQHTEPFKMASFFDPDAPGRPIRIPMPLDISPAGLRKYNKNATFMISDMLCGKIRKIRKITLGDLVLSVLPWPFHKDLPDPGETGPCKSGGNTFGMFCSLSIPIVTLCALILLIIMVTLFDIFFKWLPLLFLCLPIPGLGGKKNGT